MNLSQDMRKILTDEINYVVKQMRNTDDPLAKLYFFSAVYGATFRLLNIQFAPELVFAHHVLNNAYNQIHAVVSSISRGEETLAHVPPTLFDRLEETLEELAAKVERDEQLYPELQKIANLAYSTTGNGYYLYLKGLLHV